MKSMKNKSVHLFRIASVITTFITTLGLIATVMATPASQRGCRVTPVTEQYGIGHSIMHRAFLRVMAACERPGNCVSQYVLKYPDNERGKQLLAFDAVTGTQLR